MKLKSLILGLFVFAFTAAVHAQHTPKIDKVQQIEKSKPLKYQADKKVVSRKQTQSKVKVAKGKTLKNKKATHAKSKALYKKEVTAKQSKKVAYKKRSATKQQAVHTKKYQLRKSKAAAKKRPSKAQATH